MVIEGNAHPFSVAQHPTGHQGVEDTRACQGQAEIEPKQPPVLHMLIKLQDMEHRLDFTMYHPVYHEQVSLKHLTRKHNWGETGLKYWCLKMLDKINLIVYQIFKMYSKLRKVYNLHGLMQEPLTTRPLRSAATGRLIHPSAMQRSFARPDCRASPPSLPSGGTISPSP